MTIGIQLLRQAKEKLEAAIAAIKDELKNPDTADIVKDQVPEIGSEFDLHLQHLADHFPHESLPDLAPTNIQDAEAAGDNKEEDAPEPGDPSLPSAEDLDKVAEEQAATEATAPRETVFRRIENGTERVISNFEEATGTALGEAKFNIC